MAQCKEDYDAFNGFINDANDMGPGGRKLRVNVWFRPHSNDLPQPPLAPEELRGLGFHGYALDFLECPEGMRWYFMRDVNMHRTALGPDSVDIGRAMDAVARGAREGGCSFITGKTMSSVSRSAYGQRKVQNSTRDIGQPKNWVNRANGAQQRPSLAHFLAELGLAAVDEGRRQELIQQLEDFKGEEKRLDAVAQDLQAREKKIRQTFQVYEQQKVHRCAFLWSLARLC